MLHYNFENYTAGLNIVVYKGLMGSYNATIGWTSSIIRNDYATGTNCLSLIGEGTSNGGYLQIPGFKWIPTFLISPNYYTICFWYEKPVACITKTNARILDLYYDSNIYCYIYFNSSGNLVKKKKKKRWVRFNWFYNKRKC